MSTTETFRKAARDPAEFGSYYLAHYFTRRSPPFHRQLSALWRRRVMKNRDPVSDCAAMLTEKGTRSAIAAPPVSYTHLDVYKRQPPLRPVAVKAAGNVPKGVPLFDGVGLGCDPLVRPLADRGGAASAAPPGQSRQRRLDLYSRSVTVSPTSLSPSASVSDTSSMRNASLMSLPEMMSRTGSPESCQLFSMARILSGSFPSKKGE